MMIRILMLPRADTLYTMAVKVIYLVILGLLLGLCSAVNSTPVSSSSCRGYCEIFSDICKNGGTCVEPDRCSNTGSCKCPPNYGGEHCQKLLNPGEGNGAEKTTPKPRVKNNLLLFLFKSLAGPRGKSPNHFGSNPKSTDYQKDDSGTSSQGQVKLTTKQTTTTSTTTTTTTTTTTVTPTTTTTTTPTTTTPTTTTTIPTTTTVSTTTTTTAKPTTPVKTTESTTTTIPVTTDVNSIELTTLPGETLFTTDDRLNVVSEETTTDGITEVSTSTELSQEASATAPISQTKVLPTAGILPTVDMTLSIKNVNDDKMSDISVSGQESSSDDQGTNSHPTSERLPANDLQTQQRPVVVSSTIVTPLIDRAVEKSLPASKESPLSRQEAAEVNQQPQTNADVVKQGTHSTDLIKTSESSLVSIMSRTLESVTAPNVPFSDKPGINIGSPETSTISKSTGEERASTAETSSSSSSSKEQITTPSFSVTKLLQKMLTRPILDSISKPQLKEGTSADSDQSKTAERQPLMEDTIINNMKKAFEKAIVDKSKEPSSVAATGATPTLSDSSTNGIQTASKKNSPPVVDNVTKKVSKNGTGAAPKQEAKIFDKINNLTNRITEEFAKTVMQIITSVLSESDSTTSIPKTVASTKNMDIIIPENVNNLTQMDQHLSSKLNLANKASKQLASTLPEKLSETSGIQPKVEGQILAESQTTSPQDVQSTTSSREE